MFAYEKKVKNYWGYTSVFIKNSLRNVSVQVFKENFSSGVEHSANKETKWSLTRG